MWGIEIVLSGGIHRNDAAAASTFASGVTVHHPPHQAARDESMRRQPPIAAPFFQHKPEARDDAGRVALPEHAAAVPGLALSAGSSSYAPSPPGTWPWLAAHHQYQALFSWSPHQVICRFMHIISGAGKGIKFVWGRGNCRFGSSGFRVGNEQRTWPYWQQAPSPL